MPALSAVQPLCAAGSDRPTQRCQTSGSPPPNITPSFRKPRALRMRTAETWNRPAGMCCLLTRIQCARSVGDGMFPLPRPHLQSLGPSDIFHAADREIQGSGDIYCKYLKVLAAAVDVALRRCEAPAGAECVGLRWRQHRALARLACIPGQTQRAWPPRRPPCCSLLAVCVSAALRFGGSPARRRHGGPDASGAAPQRGGEIESARYAALVLELAGRGGGLRAGGCMVGGKGEKKVESRSSRARDRITGLRGCKRDGGNCYGACPRDKKRKRR